MKRFWVSWYQLFERDGAFEWHGPWWVSGVRDHDDAETICAAVVARDEAHARELVEQSFDRPHELEWRFVNERADDWEPFGDRFERADWMRWPPQAHRLGLAPC